MADANGRRTGRALGLGLLVLIAADARRVEADFFHRIEDIRPGTTGSASTLPYPMVEAGGRIFLPADDGANGCELWTIDALGLDAELVENISGSGGGLACPAPLLVVGERVVFAANDGFQGNELWASDGTPGGTVMLEDQTAGPGSTILGFANFRRLGTGAAVVQASGRLQLVDGTVATGLTEIPGTTNVSALLGALAQSVLYEGSGSIWRAGASGAALVVDPSPGPGGTVAPGVFAPFRTLAAFSADDGGSGLEPWVTDISGGDAGRLLDIVPGMGTSAPANFVGTDDRLYFTATEPTHGRELWIHRGVSGLTELVEDIRPGNNSSNPAFLTELDGRLYFVADDGVHGAELWVSDGTPAGTAMVEEIGSGATGAAITKIWAGGKRIYFSRSGTFGGEIWQSDGTVAGTLLVELGQLLGEVVELGEVLFARGDSFDGGVEPWAFALGDQQHGPLCNRTLAYVPDDDTDGVAGLLHLSDPAAILDLDILVDLSHTYVNDLTLTLTHVETSTSIVLVDRLLNASAGECTGDDLDISFDDEAAALPGSACTSADPALPRYAHFKPEDALSAFDGQPVAGTWRLDVVDNVGQDLGAIQSWCLGIRTALIANDGFESATLGGWSAAAE